VLSAQRSDGSWLSSQTSDASLASQLVFLLAYRGEASSVLAKQAAAAILEQQAPTGGWSPVPGGPTDVSLSVQAYLALKLTGVAANDERLTQARAEIRRLGGADAADSMTRYFLALFGQIDYDRCPAIRPESLLRGNDRNGRLAPLALVWSLRAVRAVEMEVGVRELFIDRPCDWPQSNWNDMTDAPRNGSVNRAFANIAHSLRSAWIRYSERIGWLPLRRRALQRAEAMLLQNVQPSCVAQLDLGELVWHAIALHAAGFSPSSNELRLCAEALKELAHVESDAGCLQLRAGCTAGADTIVALQALSASGVAAHHPCSLAGVTWLRRRTHSNRRLGAMELSRLLDALCTDDGNSPQCMLVPDIQVLHDHSPDSLGLRKRRSSHVRRFAKFVVQYLIDHQNHDGGWGPKNGGPSTPDATSAVLEAIASYAADPSPRVRQATDRAVEFLRNKQCGDGSWDSATGVRFIYGTSLAVRALAAAGVKHDDDVVAAGINWLLAHQLPSGGWGETAHVTLVEASDEFLAGPATASQTAWALLALVAAGRSSSEAVRRGVHFLVETQADDGGWREVPFVHRDAATGRWFRSELHSTVEPLLALSRWAMAAGEDDSREQERAPLRLVGANLDD
jgi:squalene-hopene/tetraprenyl-beta-curcumene cyclase